MKRNSTKFKVTYGNYTTTEVVRSKTEALALASALLADGYEVTISAVKQ
jgi:hypothetical protein